jgi:hypothetical protein
VARNPFTPQGPKKLPKEYTDKNLNAPLPMPPNPAPMQTNRFSSANAMAAPRAPAMPSAPGAPGELSPRAARFRRLAGILGPKK